ncbi:MAG: hypothetical protein ACPHK8_02140 [Thermoplasmatota archaeon]
MKSDTIIGIIGSILLIGIMIGVFAYEYNNVEEVDKDEIRKEAFNMGQYGHLEADGDLDGDGIPNFKDSDLDGDGVANGDDASLERIFDFNGNFQAAADPVGSHAAQALVGVKKIDVLVTMSPTAPVLLETFTIDVSVNGTVLASGEGPFSIDGQVGTIDVTIRPDAVTLGGSYQGSIVVRY